MKFSQILNELQGISFNARAWTPIIQGALSYYHYTSKSKFGEKSPNLEIPGQRYPNEYQQFPLDYIHFTVDPNFGNGAGYDEQKSGYQNNGEYHVYFHFGPGADESAINHELKHAFEDYMRISKGHKPLKTTKETINFFGDAFEKFMMSPSARSYFHPLSSLMEGLYYTSKIERSAFSDTVYDMGEKKGHFEEYIETLVRYADANRILSKIDDEKLMEEKWVKLKENYPIKILNKFNTYKDFIIWACNEIQYKGNITLKKLRKVRYFGSQHKKEGDI